jgi:hypothetical protein
MKRPNLKPWPETLDMLRKVAEAKRLSQVATIHQLVHREYRRLKRLGKIPHEREGQGE